MFPVDEIVHVVSAEHHLLLQNNQHQMTTWFGLVWLQITMFLHDSVGTFEASSLFFSCKC
jgi:hypothetical protein